VQEGATTCDSISRCTISASVGYLRGEKSTDGISFLKKRQHEELLQAVRSGGVGGVWLLQPNSSIC